MTEERKKNGIVIFINPSSVDIQFGCEYENYCDFAQKDKDGTCSYCVFFQRCSNGDAILDAMNRSAAVINEEQCRRANEKAAG